MKKYLFGILAITLAVGFSAFTTKKAQKPVLTKVHYYIGDFQRVEPGVTTGTDIEKSMTFAQFTTEGNWTEEEQSFTSYAGSDGNSYVGKISFTYDADGADGDNDGQLILSEALAGVWASYIAQSPDELITGTPILVDADPLVNTNSAPVTVVKAESAH